MRCGTLDSFDVGALGSEPLVVFCIATAGKGELCATHEGAAEDLCVGLVTQHNRCRKSKRSHAARRVARA